MPSCFTGTRLGLLSGSDLPPLLTGSVFDLDPRFGLDTFVDGASVGSITDTVTSTALTQATGSQKPVLQLAGPGGRPMLKFTAANSQILSAAGAVSALNTQNLTVFIVAWGLVDSDGLAGRVFANFTSGGGTNTQGFHITKLTTGNVFQLTLGIGSSSNTTITLGSSLLASGAHILAASIRGQTTARTRPMYDNTLVSTSAAAYKQQTSSVTAPSLGGATGGGNYYNGGFSRLIAFGSDLSDDQMQYMQYALRARYGTP